MFLQDKAVDLDDLTLIEDDTIFKLVKMTNLPYEKDRNVQMSMTIEMSLELLVVARTGYTILDVLSDVGGIQSLLMTITTLWIGVWNYKHFDNYMASKLFKVHKNGSKEKAKPIGPPRYFNIVERLMDLLPRRLLCCRRSRA